VRMVGDPAKGKRDVEIQSVGGNIVLTVPSALSMDFDITLTYTKNSRRTYGIISDFEMKQEETDEWDRDKGRRGSTSTAQAASLVENTKSRSKQSTVTSI